MFKSKIATRSEEDIKKQFVNWIGIVTKSGILEKKA